jgi:hypothetical protein
MEKEKSPAPEDFSQKQILMICPVHQIAMTDKDSSPLTIEGRPILMDGHAENTGKIRFHEEIMVSLTEMNRDTLFFQLNQTVDNGPESRINSVLAAKPEIKEIPEDKEMVDAHAPPGWGAALFATVSLPQRRFSSVNLKEESQQGLIMGVLLVSEVGIGKKNTTQGSFRALGCDFMNWDHENHIAKIAKMINLQEPLKNCLYLSQGKHGKEAQLCQYRKEFKENEQLPILRSRKNIGQ